MKRMLTIAILMAASTSICYAQNGSANTQFGVNQQGAQKITNGPVIEYTTDHSAVIAWSTKEPAGTYVAYGTDPNNLNHRSEKTWGGTNHRVELKSLTPGTVYYFQVRSENAQGSGADVQSEVAKFATGAKGTGADRQNHNVGVNGAGSEMTNAGRVALHRLAGANGHLYTTNEQEISSAASAGMRDEGVAGYCMQSQSSGTVPLYRMSNAAGDHFYTVDAAERDRVKMQEGYRDEGVACYVSQTQQAGTEPLYRLLGRDAKHLYTTSASERSQAMQSGAKDEGTAGYLWQQ